jgi:hypothetical protein
MLAVTSKVKVPGLTGHDVSDFMMSCTDEQYRQWWPGTHLRLHVLNGATGGEGDVMVMDEFVGRRRLRLRGVVEAFEPGRRIVWRFHKIVPLPARLSLVFSPTQDGVCVQHTVTAGWPGIGRVLDPLLRLYFTAEFTADLDDHVRIEFPLLRNYLRDRPKPETHD